MYTKATKKVSKMTIVFQKQNDMSLYLLSIVKIVHNFADDLIF